MAHARNTATQTLPQARLPEGWRLMPFDVLDSTNTALRRMVEAGTQTDEGLVVTAKAQTAGRGRGSRAWLGPVGNLFASFLVESHAGLEHAAELGFVAAVSVFATVQYVLPGRADETTLHCKWPNDVLLDGAKISGILLETVQAPDSTAVYVVVGIGLNLVPVKLAQPLYQVTSLAEHGARVAPTQVLEVLAQQLHMHIETWRNAGFDAIRKTWLARAAGLNDMITVNLPSEVLMARFVDLDHDGALVLEEKSGNRRRIMAGDVILSSKV